MNRCKRCISILLISAMLLGLFSTSALAATTSGELKSFEEQSSTFFAGETKNFSFTPTDDSGLYIFQLSGPSYYDHDQEFFHVTCGGKAINSVYEGGGSTNCYVVPLTQAQDYIVSFTNPVDSQATFQISATRLQYLTDVMTLPGSTTLNAAEDGSLSGYLSVKVTQDGWYSFLSENHDGWVDVYSVDLSPVGACGWARDWSDMLLESIYLKQGDYILRIVNFNYGGGEESSVVFQGKTSSPSSISTEASAQVFLIGSSETPGINCVTFTPLETGTYTFHMEFPTVEGPWVERLTLYYSDMTQVANCTTSYDEESEHYGDLTAVLTAGNTYYLEIIGSSAVADTFGYCGGTVSVSRSGSSLTGSITDLYPANGSIFDFANTSADTRPRIFFDREVADISGGAKLDFSKGTLEIRKASNDELVYSVKESSATSGASTNVGLWNVDGKPTAICLHDATTILDYGTEYYVTMPAGFVKFADGASSPAIEKGDWSFKSAPSPFSYAVTYLLNGGDGTVPEERWSVGEKVTIIQDIPEKAGFIFDGWSDGSTTYQPGESFTMPDHDVLLTAIWIKRCTVTYDLNGGTGISSSKSYLAGETVTIISDEPTKEGYVFDGWTDGSTTYQPGVTFTMPDHDVTLKAVWEAIYSPPTSTFTVTYLLDGGEGEIPAQQYPLNDVVAVTSQKPTKEGSIFAGWTDGNKTYQPGESFKMPDHDVTLTALWTDETTNIPTPGNTGSKSSSTTYNIIISPMTGGTVATTSKSASKGSTVTITVKPNADYVLDDLTVIDKNGSKLKLTQKSDNKYTFTMPASKVTVSATFSEIEQEAQRWINPYTDVFEDAYYYDAVQWAVKNGITTGTSSTTFGPGTACTRAQAVTFLWRAAGSPAPMNTEMPFADVAADAYYQSAVLWAVEQGITTGTSATTFEPDAKCSRAQIVTFLWRSKKSPVSETVNCFPDVVADAYYYNAVQWATKNGITSGTSATTFSPNNDCTRAQIITFLYRSANS